MSKIYQLAIILFCCSVHPLMAQDDEKVSISAGLQTTVVSTVSDFQVSSSYDLAIGNFVGASYHFTLGKHQLKAGLLVEQRRIQYTTPILLTDVLGIPSGALEPESAVNHYNFSLHGLYTLQYGRWTLGGGMQLRYQPNPTARLEFPGADDIERFTIRSLNKVYVDIPLEVSFRVSTIRVFTRYERSLNNRLIEPNGIKEHDNTFRLGVFYYL